MNFLSDWKFWLVVISIIKDFIVVLGVILVKFNDLHHISKDVKDLKSNINKIFNKLGKIEKSQVAITTRCNERHKK